MNVLVIGCGRLGADLAGMLDSHGHSVVVVEESPALLDRLPDDFSGQTVTGMPMDMSVLRSAGIENCDAVAVVTPDDNLNITISQIAQEFFHVNNVIARVSDPMRGSVFASFGLHTVCPTNMASSAIYDAITEPWESRQVTIGTSTVSFHTWQADSAWAGKLLSQAPHNADERIFAFIHANGSMELPDVSGAGQRLTAGDRVVLASVAD